MFPEVFHEFLRHVVKHKGIQNFRAAPHKALHKMPQQYRTKIVRQMRARRYGTGSEGKFASRWRASPDALCGIALGIFPDMPAYTVHEVIFVAFSICRHCCGRVLPDSFCCPAGGNSAAAARTQSLSTPNRNSDGMRHFCSKFKGLFSVAQDIEQVIKNPCPLCKRTGFLKSLSNYQAIPHKDCATDASSNFRQMKQSGVNTGYSRAFCEI
ncbi:MAG: hypothetical protein ACLSFT_04725 [Ruminococcus callidus]